MSHNLSQCLKMSHNLSQCLTIFNNVLTICLTMLCLGSKSCQLALFNSYTLTLLHTSLNTPEFSSPLWCNSATAQFVAVFVYNFVVVLVCTLVDILVCFLVDILVRILVGILLCILVDIFVGILKVPQPHLASISPMTPQPI